MKVAIGIGAAAAAAALAIWMSARPPASAKASTSAKATADKTAGKPDAAKASTSAKATADKTAGEPMSQAKPVPQTTSKSVLTEDEQGRVARALASGRMEMPANMTVLRGHTGPLPGPRDPTPALAPTGPVGTAVIEARPQFSWTERPGATRYSIAVFDERFREVAKSGPLKTTTWTPRQNLPRGRVLAWQVTAVSRDETIISPSPSQPKARFVVLEAAEVARLVKERARLATEPIALGLVLVKAGLFAEADSVFQTALTDERYDRSQVRALLARLRAR